jgi:IstB-like ATP binding protein
MHVGLTLGLAACRKGFSVTFTTAAALVNQLMEARDERRRLKLQRDLQAVKLLIVDELGYVPLSPTGAELLFETFSQRYERGSTIVTSNLPFEDWTSVLGSERLTGALLELSRRGDELERTMGDDDAVPMRRRRTGEEAGALARDEVGIIGDQNAGGRVELQELPARLGEAVAGHHHHRLGYQAKPLLLHDRGGER